MPRKTIQKRSMFGGHWTGTGIVRPAEWDDDYKRQRGGRKRSLRPKFDTDQFDSSKEGKAAFKKYCEEQSGEVTTYTIHQPEEASD